MNTEVESLLKVPDYWTSILSNQNEQSGNYKLLSKIEEFEDLLQKHEISSCNKYVTYKTNGSFKGEMKNPGTKPKVHWGLLGNVSASLATTPYLIVSTRYYSCHLGKCHFAYKSKNYAAKQGKETKKQYKKVTGSKKVGCPASFKVYRLVVFPNNKLENDSKSDRARMGYLIRQNLANVAVISCYLFRFPDQKEHENHIINNDAVGKEPIDKKIIDKIEELVFLGVSNILEVLELLESFVIEVIGVTDRSRRRFYPSKKDVRRLLTKAKIKLKNSKNDQDHIEDVIKKLNSSPRSIFFRPSSLSKLNDNKNLIFVYQNEEMKRLYNLYGQECVLLDPTHRYCELPFPLYFVVVQTNVNYQIVAIFMTELCSLNMIQEGLSIIKTWNPEVQPTVGITDNGSEELEALENVFDGLESFIGQFYFRSTWANNLKRQDTPEALAYLQKAVDAVTEENIETELNYLKDWPPFKSFKGYFEKIWQKNIRKWCSVHRPKNLLFETNDQIIKLDEELCHSLVSQHRLSSLSNLIEWVCNHLVPVTLQNYYSLNAQIAKRIQSNMSSVPYYLLQCPQWIVNHILKVLVQVQKVSERYIVEKIDTLMYRVIECSAETQFCVKLFPSTKYFECDCSDFIKMKTICKHLIVLGNFDSKFSLEKISSWLFDRPIFKLDSNCPIDDLIKICDNSPTDTPEEETVFLSPKLVGTKTVKGTSGEEPLVTLERIRDSLSPTRLLHFNQELMLLCDRWQEPPRQLNNSKTEDSFAFCEVIVSGDSVDAEDEATIYLNDGI